jgi:hypothetical protein
VQESGRNGPIIELSLASAFACCLRFSHPLAHLRFERAQIEDRPVALGENRERFGVLCPLALEQIQNAKTDT